MNRIIGFLIILFFAGCVNRVKDTGWDITIRGKVGFPQSGKEIEIQEISQEQNVYKDTIVLKGNYTFEKKVHLKEPGYYRISFYKRQFVDLILDKTDIEVNVDGNDPMGFMEIKGSPDHDLIMDVQKIINDVQNKPEVFVLEQQFRAATQAQDEKKVVELQEKYLAIKNSAHDSVVQVLKRKPVSLGMINLLLNNNVLDRDRYYSFYEETAERVKVEWPNSKYTAQFTELVEKMRITAVGQKAPEIALPNPDGDTVKLSSLQGKYVLVDFWAKWCGPCRGENPNVVKAYQKYKDQGFEVFGVSLDRTKEDWLQAIQEDGLTWTHVSDLKYFDSQAARDYNITGIPFSILVDPNGVIIAKNLRGSNLDKKLAEIFKKS